MRRISFSDGLAIAGLILAIVLVVLDKAEKLKGPLLLVLLGVAACMAIPLLFSVPWVAEASAGMPRITRQLLMVFLLGALWAFVAIWITPATPESATTVPPAPQPSSKTVSLPFPNITIGCTTFIPMGTFLDQMSKGIPVPFMSIKEKNGVEKPLLSFYVKDGKTFANIHNLAITDNGTAFSPAFNIEDNHVIVFVPDWDSNANDKAIEVIDGKGLPVAQIIHKSDTSLIVNIRFLVRDLAVLMTRDKVTVATSGKAKELVDTQISLPTMFLYPSWKYPGEFAPETKTEQPCDKTYMLQLWKGYVVEK
jgi:hypothetical protein